MLPSPPLQLRCLCYPAPWPSALRSLILSGDCLRHCPFALPHLLLNTCKLSSVCRRCCELPFPAADAASGLNQRLLRTLVLAHRNRRKPYYRLRCFGGLRLASDRHLPLRSSMPSDPASVAKPAALEVPSLNLPNACRIEYLFAQCRRRRHNLLLSSRPSGFSIDSSRPNNERHFPTTYAFVHLETGVGAF